MQQFLNWKTKSSFNQLWFGRQSALELVFDYLFDRFEASELVRKVERLIYMREWSVPTTNSLNRRLEMQEAFILDCCSELSSKPVC